MKKTILIIIAFVSLVVFISRCSIGQKQQLLYEAVYTQTGKYWSEGEAPVRSVVLAQVFHAQIYKDSLIDRHGDAWHSIAQKYRYDYIGIDDQNCRIYQNNGRRFVVDSDFNITIIVEWYDMRFGWGNVRKDTYYEVVKGDYSEDIRKELEQDMQQYRYNIK